MDNPILVLNLFIFTLTKVNFKNLKVTTKKTTKMIKQYYNHIKNSPTRKLTMSMVLITGLIELGINYTNNIKINNQENNSNIQIEEFQNTPYNNFDYKKLFYEYKLKK